MQGRKSREGREGGPCPPLLLESSINPYHDANPMVKKWLESDNILYHKKCLKMKDAFEPLNTHSCAIHCVAYVPHLFLRSIIQLQENFIKWRVSRDDLTFCPEGCSNSPIRSIVGN